MNEEMQEKLAKVVDGSVRELLVELLARVEALEGGEGAAPAGAAAKAKKAATPKPATSDA